jgi:competence protein ComFC
MNSDPFSLILDLIFPKFNLDYTNFSHYLDFTEIKKEHAKIIDLDDKNLKKILICSKYKKNIKDLIKRAKINGETQISNDLAILITTAQKKLNIEFPEAITYVPADPKRFNLRGYHLPELLAQKISKKMYVPCLDLLVKNKHTKSQTELNRKNRLTNLKNSFSIRNNSMQKIKNIKNIWLIDDVTTTHTTLLECSETIKKDLPNLEVLGVTLSG